MALSNIATSIGLSAFAAGTGGVGLLAAGAAGTVISGILGFGRSRRVAGLQEDIAGIQNQIFAEQTQTRRENLMLQRREMFRQGEQRLAGSRVAAVASGSSRSSAFARVQETIRDRTQANTGRITRALESGERLSGLSQELSSLQSDVATQSQPSFLETII